MFGFGSGKAGHTNLGIGSSGNAKGTKHSTFSNSQLLEPAIDGPPSTARIRAYTEQMRRGSIFGHNTSSLYSSRTETISSATSSSRSRDSAYGGLDVSLSRQSSDRSVGSSMASVRLERPDSSHGFGSLFTRSNRRRRATNVDGLRSSTSSFSLREMASEERAQEYHRTGHRRRHFISEPYNFQHVTHTRQDQLPDLARTKGTELMSEFSAIRAAQIPTNGELKGIKAQDLHFNNFSSEALSITTEEPAIRASNQSPRQRTVLRKRPVALDRKLISGAKIHESIRSPPPSRQSQSFLSTECPLELPVRTSSRMASVSFDSVRLVGSTLDNRPFVHDCTFAEPESCHELTLSPKHSIPSEPQLYSSRLSPHALQSPTELAWPLPTPSSSFANELEDVPEEAEESSKGKSRISSVMGEFKLPECEDDLEVGSHRAEARMSTTLSASSFLREISKPTRKQPLSPGFQMLEDSWESDIDWCYENEVEATCDFDWTEKTSEESTPPAYHRPSALNLQVQDDERVYYGSFRPSLLVPSMIEVPELSPAPTEAGSNGPLTPAYFAHSNHKRVPSQSLAAKPSQDFTMAPTLSILAEFRSQLEQDALYDDERPENGTVSAPIFTQQPYNPSISSVDEIESSVASNRSSDFSQSSARSSSSTRISAPQSYGSQDSSKFLSCATNDVEATDIPNYESPPSYCVPSEQTMPILSLSENVAALQHNATSGADELILPSDRSVLHRRNKSLHIEPEGGEIPTLATFSHFINSKGEFPGPNPNLTALAETSEVRSTREHERKISAPVVSPTAKEVKGRTRAHTITHAPKRRGSYMLFPST